MLPILNLGLCTPDTCTAYDTERIVEFCGFIQLI